MHFHTGLFRSNFVWQSELADWGLPWDKRNKKSIPQAFGYQTAMFAIRFNSKRKWFENYIVRPAKESAAGWRPAGNPPSAKEFLNLPLNQATL
jgi:hypothetical protein